MVESELLLCEREQELFRVRRKKSNWVWFENWKKSLKFKFSFWSHDVQISLLTMHKHIQSRCDYDDVDDIQRSATLAMRMRFIIFLIPLFLFYICGIIIITQLQPRTPRFFFCVTCINITPNKFSDAARKKHTKICALYK